MNKMESKGRGGGRGKRLSKPPDKVKPEEGSVKLHRKADLPSRKRDADKRTMGSNVGLDFCRD